MLAVAAMALIFSGCNNQPVPAPKPAAQAKPRTAPVKPPPVQPPRKTAAEIAAEKQAEEDRLEQERLAAEEAKLLARAALEREESSQRLLLCTPRGPLVARIYITIDGTPFRAEATKRVDELLAALDADGDGQTPWSEAFDNAAFAVGPFETPPDDNRGRARLLRSVDLDRDGQVSREEIHFLLAHESFGAPDFDLTADPGAQLVDRYDSYVWRLLDVDDDGILSAEEFLGAAERLKSRDADDDDLLHADEVNPYISVVDPQGTMMTEDSYAGLGSASVIQLGFDAEWSTVRTALDEHYLPDDEFQPESFPMTPGLFAALDGDGDGSLADHEFVRLNRVPPHLELEVHFGRTGDLPPGIAMVELSSEIAGLNPRIARGERGVTLELSGIKVRFFSNDPGAADYQQLAAAQLAALDANSDGYLEESELPEGNPDMEFSFANLDTSGDGKVYPDELAAYIERQQAAQLKQVRATSAGLEDALYSALDTSNDGRLTLREIVDAPRRLAELDSDGDGALLKDDIPASIAVSLSRGAADAMQQAAAPRPAMVQAAPPVAGPPWFVRMDSNGDGDISPREFLGDAAKFAGLDADADGFIDLAEATAAGGEAPTPAPAETGEPATEATEAAASEQLR